MVYVDPGCACRKCMDRSCVWPFWQSDRTSSGTFGFQKLVSKFCNTERKTLLTTFVMGILIFVDDYLNVLSIGVCMKGVCDKRKIPREALAYMLDATGAVDKKLAEKLAAIPAVIRVRIL